MSSIKSPVRALIGAIGAAALLAGCASAPPPKVARIDAPTPLDQYQIKTRDVPDQVALTVHAEGLSPAQHDALAAFAARWRSAGGGMITLQAPTDAPDQDGTRSYVLAAESTLSVLGVPYDHVRTLGYVQGPAPKALVQVSFETVIAEAPDCQRVKWENLSATKDNQVTRKFGCSLTANLALQLADPRDLRGETPLAPGDNTRRMQVLSNYRTGKTTSSDKDIQASGAVSATGSQ